MKAWRKASMPRAAALEAGFTRFRPVLMTALAMIIGMLPMAFALGEGGEQNAPLGRAVIGGLLVATLATLFFVPTVFSVLHARRNRAARNPGPVSLRTKRLTGEPWPEADHSPETTRQPRLRAKSAPDRDHCRHRADRHRRYRHLGSGAVTRPR